MVFILGMNFPENRLVKVFLENPPFQHSFNLIELSWSVAEPSEQKALESFYGIGPSVSQRIMARHHIHQTMTVGSLADKQAQEITAQLSNMTIENELRRQIKENIRRLRDMGSYRGMRHHLALPVRGQRTRTQTNTARKLNRIDRKG